MKKALLSMALLSLITAGTASAQDQNKKDKDQKTEQVQQPEQTTELNTQDNTNQAPSDVIEMKNDDQQVKKADEPKQFEPHQKVQKDQSPETTTDTPKAK
jgi:hypothetical protein